MSIIVDTLETAQLVLEINKKIKGQVINIYPLENISDLKKPLKNVPSNVKSMLDVVKLKQGCDQRLQMLVEHVFANTVLAKNYEDAMRVAQDFKLNCITTDF